MLNFSRARKDGSVMNEPIRLYRKDFNGQPVSRVALYKVSGGYSLAILGELGTSFTERKEA